jgi:hypothetical protein
MPKVKNNQHETQPEGKKGNRTQESVNTFQSKS